MIHYNFTQQALFVLLLLAAYVCITAFGSDRLGEMQRRLVSHCNTVSFVRPPQELYERCDKLRRSAFKMATEAEDNDASLGLPLAVVPPLLSSPYSTFWLLGRR